MNVELFSLVVVVVVFFFFVDSYSENNRIQQRIDRNCIYAKLDERIRWDESLQKLTGELNATL